MQLAVCVKCVPPLSPPRSLDVSRMRIVRDSLALNAADLHALEEALRLRDSLGKEAVDVVVVTVGDARAANPLRDAFARGAARCVLVSDEVIGGSDLLATSRVLAAALGHTAPEMILFGQEANDSNGALIWAAVAERLQMPMISRVTSIDSAAASTDGVAGHAAVRRQSEHGAQTVESPLPCVLSIAASANQPRYTTLKDVIAARSRTCEVMSLADLGVDAALVGPSGSGTSVGVVERAQPERSGLVVEDPDAGAAALVRLLSEEGLL